MTLAHTATAPRIASASQSETGANLHAQVEPKLFNYHIPWRASAFHAGASLTSHHGSGSDFAGFAPLLACPDPRRVDVRASARTMPQQWLVRTYLERSAIRVFAIVDVSSSMQFHGPAKIRQQITELVASIAWSSTRQGDAFGMLGANDAVQPAWHMRPGYQATAAQQAAHQATAYWLAQAAGQTDGQPSPRMANAIPEAIAGIGLQRSLLFVISDFYWPESLLQKTLQAAGAHDVVPIVLRDPAATEALPAFGWARLRDMETGVERSWLLRRPLHQRIRQHALVQRQALAQRLQQAGTRPPLWLATDWRAADISQHLLETAA